MPYAWMGTNLEIDLSRGTVRKVKGDPRLVRDYLGGKGLGAKILWDRVPPETVKAYSPDNFIVITSGLLTGTTIPATNRCVMSFISPATDLYYHSAIGGFWATELKHAGYDNIIISGKSPVPVYLWINNEKVELREAGHLWGRGTIDTRKIICQELKNDAVQIACIGPAGENRVHAAAVMCGTGSSASRGGIGALWGDKKLKAIAVYGTNDVNVANPRKLNELCNYIIGRSVKTIQARKEWPSRITGSGRTRDVWYGYFNEPGYGRLAPDSPLRSAVEKNEEKWQNFVARRAVRSVSCSNCVTPCRLGFEYRGGLSVIKCNSILPFLAYSKYFDYDWALDCFNWAEEMGLDIQGIPRYAAFGIDLYQRCILTKSDTDGMHLEFGNPDVFRTLMEKIVQRKGIGDVLANGTLKAAQQIGKGAEEIVQVSKRQEPRLTSMYIYKPYYALAVAVSDRGDIGGYQFSDLEGWSNLSREAREALIRDGWFKWPRDYEKYFLADFSHDGLDYEPACQLHAYAVEGLALFDSTGFCHRTTAWNRYTPINKRVILAELISNATGMDIDEAEAAQIANRIVNLSRAYTRRFGLRREDDTVPKIHFEQDPTPPRHRLHPKVFDKWLDRFYELRGWDKEGVPTAETLEKLGLDDVRQELERRGILPAPAIAK